MNIPGMRSIGRLIKQRRARLRPHAETIAQSKRIAEALVISHIGDVNAMSSEQALTAMRTLKGDEALQFATLRVLAGSVVAFATAAAAATTERGTSAFDERSAELARGVIERIDYKPYE